MGENRPNDNEPAENNKNKRNAIGFKRYETTEKFQ
jgi:hypothetical protein